MTVEKESIGENNFQMSKLILGWWRLTHWNYSDSQILDLITGSLELGITSHDHADIYGGYECEELFGNVLKANPSLRKNWSLLQNAG